MSRSAKPKKHKRFRKVKSYSKKAKQSVQKNYPIKNLPPFAEIASRFKPLNLASIPELAPHVETVVGDETVRNFSYAAHPTGDASARINKTIGCCRVLHNKFVECLYAYLKSIDYKGGYINGYKVPLYPEIKEMINKDYMDEPDATAYTNVRDNFEQAIDKFNKEFVPHGNQYTKKALRRVKNGGAPLTFRDLKGMPKFHAKFRATDAYTSNMVSGNISLVEKPNHLGELSAEGLFVDDFHIGNFKNYKAYAWLKLPKTEKFELVLHRPLPVDAKIKKVNVRREKWGEYTVTLTVSFHRTFTRIKNTPEAQAAVKAYLEEHLDLALGLDYAQQEGCVPSGNAEQKEDLDLLIAAAFGKNFRHMVSRLAFLKRRLRKKRRPDHANGIEASLSYKKLQSKISKLEAKIANRRKDALEKLSRVLSNAFLLVAVEDINLRAMSQGFKLAKNLMDNGFGMFREMLNYKLTEQGKLYVVIGKCVATSQECNDCGYKNPDTKDLGLREWDCPVCGAHHNRDYNAAENIRDEGIRTLENAKLFEKKKKGKATVERYTPKSA